MLCRLIFWNRSGMCLESEVSGDGVSENWGIETKKKYYFIKKRQLSHLFTSYDHRSSLLKNRVSHFFQTMTVFYSFSLAWETEKFSFYFWPFLSLALSSKPSKSRQRVLPTFPITRWIYLYLIVDFDWFNNDVARSLILVFASFHSSTFISHDVMHFSGLFEDLFFCVVFCWVWEGEVKDSIDDDLRWEVRDVKKVLKSSSSWGHSHFLLKFFSLIRHKMNTKTLWIVQKKNRTESLTKSYKLSVTLLTVVCVHFNSFEIFSHSFFFWLVGCCVFSWIILMVLDSFIFFLLYTF